MRYPKLQPNRPKREMFEALMPVASSSSPTHDIYGNTVIIISALPKEGTTVNIHNAHYGFKIAFDSIVYYY